MTIVEALRQHNVRVDNGATWLVATESGFIVYRKRYGTRNVEVLIATDDEAEAVKVLLGEAEGEAAH